jgi:methylated-DNA-[protein]-cysteine S-methyltransferase
MQQRFAQIPEAPPPVDVHAACDAIRALLAGEPRDLAEIVLDYEDVPDFHRRVYEIARRIAPGSTRSYGEIAAELGDKGLSRAVGQALGHNPFAPVVPCHRVLAAGGKPGGFSAHGGAAAKLRMLMIEGARPPSDTAPLF